MASTVAEKLKIKEGYSLLTVNAPADFKKELGTLPDGVKIKDKGTGYDQIHWFVKSKAEVDKQISGILKLLTPGILCWIYFPKGSSGIQTDLTRDKGWENLVSNKNFQWLVLISFNDTWSAFSFRLKTEKDEKKSVKPTERPILEYIDATKKIVRLPDDLAPIFKKDKEAATFFDSLSFSNKKEYVEWIVTAKREETRQERIKGTIERLHKKWKNPRNI